MQNGGGGGIPMEELQRQRQGLTDPEGQGQIFSMKLIEALSFYLYVQNYFGHVQIV